MRSRIIALVVITFLMLIINIQGTIQHEKVHQQIMEKAGCTSYNTTYGFLSGYSFTKCNSYQSRSQEMMLTEYQLHEMNEIITYNLHIIRLLIYVGIMVYVTFSFKGEKK